MSCSTVCWWCARALVLPYFSEVKDHDGHLVRVHKICAKQVERAFTSSGLEDLSKGGMVPLGHGTYRKVLHLRE